MESRIKDNKLDQDLKTIVECEVDSANNDCCEDLEFEMNFNHLELRSQQDTRPDFKNMNFRNNNNKPLEELKMPLNLWGSRTYTSPASFDSSSGDSCPFKSKVLQERRLPQASQNHTNGKSNSIATKLRSDQQSEKFIMLRNVVENINDPQKRKVLLDFLDQSTLKTEYVTMRESSSSGEEVKGLRKLNKLPKRRYKSPQSVLPRHHLHRNKRNVNAYSQERKRFSLAQPRIKTVAEQDQNVQNFVIERKNGSDEFDSKNGDKCFTEESKEVPLDLILNRLQNYQNPFQPRSRAQSGYSASRDEATHPGDNMHEFDYNFDFDNNLDLEDCKRHKRKEIIIIPGDLMEKDKSSSEMVNNKLIRKWLNKMKTLIFIVLVFFLVGLIARTVYLEVKISSLTTDSYKLNAEINTLYKTNADWEKRYNQ